MIIGDNETFIGIKKHSIISSTQFFVFERTSYDIALYLVSNFTLIIPMSNSP